MGKWELTFHDVLNYLIPGALLLTAIYFPIQEAFATSITNGNISVFLFLVAAYALGHVLDPAFKLSAAAARKKNKGPILKFLLGPTESDWRKFYLDHGNSDSGVPGLVDGQGLATAVNAVLGSSDGHQKITKHEDVFYTCWRLLEAEVSDGLRYHHRVMAFYNFAATMSFAFLLASPFIGWYVYQISAQWQSSCIWIPIGSTATSLVVSLIIAKLFFVEYKKYRKEWIQNVYRLFWVWYKVRYLKNDQE